MLKLPILTLIGILTLGLFYSSYSLQNPAEEILKKIQHQIEIKDFLGAKLLAERVYKKATTWETKEVAYLLYWEASGYLHYKEGQFSKILEDIGGLNLYWAYFRKNRRFEDVYYDVLGRLYTLLFQYRRAVIFFVEAYRRKPTPRRFLNIIYATEMAYYNELRPYYNIDFIKTLLKRVNPEGLDFLSKALYEFEWGFYYLLKGDYRKAYKYLKESYNLDKSFLSEGQANFFMGKALEGLGDLKKAYYFYKLALTRVKHPLFVKNTLFRLFIVTAKLGYYREANDYFFGLTKFGGLQVNPYLQEAILLIPSLGNFKKHFYWRKEYNALLALVMWLNIESDRGKKAFVFLLNDFLDRGKPFPDLIVAWKVLYPHEVERFKNLVEVEKVISLPLEGLTYVYRFYKLNTPLFKSIFGDWGYLAIAKYFFLKGDWDKALTFVEKVRLKNPLKFYIKGVILAYRGKPYILESYYNSLGEKYKINSLFWLGWGYLLNNRWDLTGLYWEQFLNEYHKRDILYGIASFYLAEHYFKIGFTDKGIYYEKKFLEFLKHQKDFKGLKMWTVLRLYPVYGDRIFKLINVDKNWQKLVKYLQIEGASKK